jgi:hypothetical protein
MDLKGNTVRRCGLDASASEQGPVAGSCGHSNELLGSIKGKEFLTRRMSVSFSRRNLLHGVRQSSGEEDPVYDKVS